MQNNSTPNGNGSDDGTRAKYRSHHQPSVKITLSISKGLLEQVDKAAEQDYTNRSDLIRMALLWYLRPQGRDLDQADPDVILKTLQHRKARAGMKKMLRETDIDVYD